MFPFSWLKWQRFVFWFNISVLDSIVDLDLCQLFLKSRFKTTLFLLRNYIKFYKTRLCWLQRNIFLETRCQFLGMTSDFSVALYYADCTGAMENFTEYIRFDPHAASYKMHHESHMAIHKLCTYTKLSEPAAGRVNSFLVLFWFIIIKTSLSALPVCRKACIIFSYF